MKIVDRNRSWANPWRQICKVWTYVDIIQSYSRKSSRLLLSSAWVASSIEDASGRGHQYSIVGYPDDVKEVMTGESGIFEHIFNIKREQHFITICLYFKTIENRSYQYPN